jgi:hypothetical protein
MISLLLIILAGILNAAMDIIVSTTRYNKSVFKMLPKNWETFFDSTTSWQNKWKDGDRDKGELFFGSSTFLVWTTDAWHLFKTLMLLCFSVAVVTYNSMINPLIDAITYWIVFGIVFELFWSKIFLKSK